MTTTRVLMSSCWLTGKYECSLGEKVQGVARQELREDESARGQSLRQLQDWISKNQDLLNCRTDHIFLLRFLRVKKFSVPLAQQMLLKYLNMRQILPHLCLQLDFLVSFLTHYHVPDHIFLLRFLRVKKFSVPLAQQMLLKYLNMRQILPHLCLQLDFLSPSISSLIDHGYIFPSPVKDMHGRRVVITLVEKFDPYKYTNSDMARAHVITYETMLEDEECQVMGFTHVGDLKAVSMAHITLWSPLEFTTLVRWGEQSYPMRHKAIHLVHVPAALRYVYDFARSRFSQKMRERFMVHDGFEELHNHVDPQTLPKEMGGKIPMKDMIDMWKHELLQKRDRLLALDEMRLLDTKGINKTTSKQSKKSIESSASLVGSFRKLEVD